MYSTISLMDRVRTIVANTFGIDEAELPDDASQENCSRWTSLYHMTLMVTLEDEFGLTFSMDELTSMTSLLEIAQTLRQHGVDSGA